MQVPPDKTDQVQPIDRGLGSMVKYLTGKYLDEWLDDDDNLDKWESNSFSASDRRILLAQWWALEPLSTVASALSHCHPLIGLSLSAPAAGTARHTRRRAKAARCASTSSMLVRSPCPAL